MRVFLLWHVQELPGGEDEKLIGVYSSVEAAERARLRAVRQPGFRDVPEGFLVSEYTLDKDNWTEGYIANVTKNL